MAKKSPVTPDEAESIRQQELAEYRGERPEPEPEPEQSSVFADETAVRAAPPAPHKAEREPAVSSALPPETALEAAPLEKPEPPRRRVGGALGQLQGYLDARIDKLGQWAAGRITADALIRFALLDYSRSDALQRCSPESIYLALIACAQIGLEPGGVNQEAFIVPYAGVAQFQLGYRGIITLARRSRQVRALVGNVVYGNDHFDYDEGSDPFVRHKRALGDRGDVIAAYALARMVDGELQLEVMPRADLDKIRDHATRIVLSPAYRDWTDQMWRKAPIRRLGKRLPLGADYAYAVQLDGAAAGGDLDGYHAALASAGVDVPASLHSPDKATAGLAGVRAALASRSGK